MIGSLIMLAVPLAAVGIAAPAGAIHQSKESCFIFDDFVLFEPDEICFVTLKCPLDGHTCDWWFTGWIDCLGRCMMSRGADTCEGLEVCILPPMTITLYPGQSAPSTCRLERNLGETIALNADVECYWDV